MKAIITSLAVATIACLSACNNSEYKPNIETTASPIGHIQTGFCINCTKLQNTEMV